LLKTDSYIDPELKDDGTSLAKPLGKSGEERLGKPKVLDFEVEEDEARLEKGERGTTT
jgi:hypothetical protein